MDDLIIREATLDDAQLLADLTRASWADKVAVTSSGHRETAVQVLQHLQQGGGLLLLVDGQPAGSVRWLPQDSDSDVWDIVRMGILPAYRGRNLSQHLLEAVVHRAREANVRELHLAVRSDQQRLMDLYAAYGFELAPELEYVHGNPLEPAPYVMRCVLES
ncbi:ribosomal protein S18 acetylase RimI-like enzyme [Paucimonas lemoignei]|uniref:Ribosomal protein S18 acetylase RimI-like enzyme n=1 Tax=Paucimonas lemoignei TaxID=29443 RepID=A0A4R3HUY2_PAULE|nr:GNAT family N-acetyltransferase [Paucimonas lemoignei]TCS34008.1 ribosomal protein S18 acetylase RimI-like enzyme [Paucimonas lemoignei]